MKNQYYAHQQYGNNEYNESRRMLNPQEKFMTLSKKNVPGQLIRKKSVKRLQLTNGNLVINCPVPDLYISNVPYQNSEEFYSARYTAVTCEPDHFSTSGYALRQQLYNRDTEIFVVLTMYNEDDVLFARSMIALAENIRHLCTRNKSQVWGPEGWKKVVVCIVADGREKIHSRVLQALGIMSVYQEGVGKSVVNGKPVQAHLYEYSTQIYIDEGMKIRGAEVGFVPMQVIFCLKEQNKKKLNSHRWFFNAFCPLLRPNVCILLDVGTKPFEKSIYHLWKAFEINPNLGGACGEIKADLGVCWSNLANPLVAAQNFEYKMSNILDKSFESVFGYISVLPGAFSAYRYDALCGRPLIRYFEGDDFKEGNGSIFKANRYLAEDRILCFELVAKSGCDWVLRYVESAKAETDVPHSVAEFISQRRRWLNGTFFASLYALLHWQKIWLTSHSIFRIMLFQFQFAYNLIQLVFSWFSLANFYLAFYFLGTMVFSMDIAFTSLQFSGINYGVLIFTFFKHLYIFAIVIIFLTSLGNRPQGSKWIYICCIFLFSIVMGLMVFLTTYIMISEYDLVLDQFKSRGFVALLELSVLRDTVLGIGLVIFIYLSTCLLHRDAWHLVTCSLQFLLLLLSFINILPIYAFCNIHDVSWGTKGSSKTEGLGAAKLVKEGAADQIELELPFADGADKESLENNYYLWMLDLAQTHHEEPQEIDFQTRVRDAYASLRTRLILFWILTNGLLVIMMTFDGLDKVISKYYISVLFLSSAGLLFVRGVGSIVYIFSWQRCC